MGGREGMGVGPQGRGGVRVGPLGVGVVQGRGFWEKGQQGDRDRDRVWALVPPPTCKEL